jgi:hypothetical protein
MIFRETINKIKRWFSFLNNFKKITAKLCIVHKSESKYKHNKRSKIKMQFPGLCGALG